ncbi:cytochrome B5-like [Primulina eburnea]|uniref:cytochrome B5-like n=1 Tax=Primulina eburnea TaxID=1245227 RepID=UPI003C6BE2E9
MVEFRVYNVTNFLSRHPGGDENNIISTNEFEDVGHGSAARFMLDEFYVGEVDPPRHETRSNSMCGASSGHVRAIADKPLESAINNRLLYFVVAFAITYNSLYGAGGQCLHPIKPELLIRSKKLDLDLNNYIHIIRLFRVPNLIN